MSVTRRELCALLPEELAPSVLLPAILPADASADEGNVLPTPMFPFETLTPRTSNSATIRDSPQRQARHGESVEVARDHFVSGRNSPPAVPPSPQ